MRPLRFHLFAALSCLVLLLGSCRQEEIPSYVGTWHYAGSTPELGEAYSGSWVELDRRWNYTFYDAPSGQSFSGTAEDFQHDGMVITLTASNELGTRTYVATLKYLKEDLMKVESSSVNGTMTEIRFTRQ